MPSLSHPAQATAPTSASAPATAPETKKNTVNATPTVTPTIARNSHTITTTQPAPRLPPPLVATVASLEALLVVAAWVGGKVWALWRWGGLPRGVRGARTGGPRW
jgi:hypothetical protein